MASQFVFDAIGTHWIIDIYPELTKSREETLLDQIIKRIQIFDKNYSRFRDDSLITEISKAPGRYTLPEDALLMFDIYRRLYEVTGGLVTPLIGQVLADAGYDADYSLKQHRPLQKPIAWDDAIDYHYPYLEVRVPVLLDFGAAGKGYLIDLVSELLEKNGIDSFCVDAGGDILYRNRSGQNLDIGLEHPEDNKKVVGTASILNESLCGSAGNRRSWGDFHHIVNPQTLASPRHILAVWTTAKSAILADAMTTALFFTDREKLTPHFNFENFILYADYSFNKSLGFKGEIFS